MREFDIATAGKSNHKGAWNNQKWTWDKLKKKLTEPLRTSETSEEYHSMSKADKAVCKDHGGFVGGYLKDGLRKKGYVKHRSLIALDADKADDFTWDAFASKYSCTALMHSTHSHTPDQWRVRLVIPLSRDISPDEHQALARLIAYKTGMEVFDRITFENERLMYWPSVPKDDTDFTFEIQEGELLDPDKELKYYTDPMDASAWPQIPGETERALYNPGLKQADPTNKTGLIGTFCRMYSIEEAIDQYLSHIYIPGSEGRYTYAEGSSANGAVVYDDGRFLYSNHGTDPINGLCVNAFDLVRIHQFGHLDRDIEQQDADVTKMKSFKEMNKFVRDIPGIGEFAAREEFDDEFSDKGPDKPKKSKKQAQSTLGLFPTDTDEEEETEEPEKKKVRSWKAGLTIDKQGEYESTSANFMLILANDENLKGRIAYNEFPERPVIMSALPTIIDNETQGKSRKANQEWPKFYSDSSGARLRTYIEKKYKISNVNKFKDAIACIFEANQFHPVRDYIESLNWDGVSRINTVLIDYLGAADTNYVRNVTRKTFIAGIHRIFQPGVKFDYMLTLVGSQGVGKSRFVKKIAVQPEWLNQSFVFATNTNRSVEAVRGKWIIEVSELVGLKKADVNNIKQFFSTEIDSYRQAYGEFSSDFRRQCLFIGTTNEHDFITDPTGGRRFWPVTVGTVGKYEIDDMPVDQIWAEAYHLYTTTKENLWLNPMEEAEAKDVQTEHSEDDPRIGIIDEYLKIPIAPNWMEMDQVERTNYMEEQKQSNGITVKGVERTRVCAYEVMIEILGYDKARIKPFEARDITRLIATKIKGWEQTKGKISFGPLYGQQKGFIKTK